MRGTQVLLLISAALSLTVAGSKSPVTGGVRVHKEGTKLYLMEDPPLHILWS